MSPVRLCYKIFLQLMRFRCCARWLAEGALHSHRPEEHTGELGSRRPAKRVMRTCVCCRCCRSTCARRSCSRPPRSRSWWAGSWRRWAPTRCGQPGPPSSRRAPEEQTFLRCNQCRWEQATGGMCTVLTLRLYGYAGPSLQSAGVPSEICHTYGWTRAPVAPAGVEAGRNRLVLGSLSEAAQETLVLWITGS